MKYLKSYEQIESENLNEGLKEWILAGALALVSAAGVKGQQKIRVINEPRSIETTKKDTTLTVDFGSHFQSGAYHFSTAKQKETEIELAKIGDFIKSHKGSHIKIMIESSESLVPNKDVETGERLPRRGLAKMRALETKDLIETFLDTLKQQGLFEGTYDTATSVGRTAYIKGEDPKQEKFTREQWVRVRLSITDKKTDITDIYKAYARREFRIFVRGPYGGGKAVADVFYPTRKTEKLDQQGNLVVGYHDILVRSLKPENVFAENPTDPYDGKLYLVPWEWWNGEAGPDGTKRQTTGIDINNDDWEYIKKNFNVN